jgi:hAT family C-terminal dimerisation region
VIEYPYLVVMAKDYLAIPATSVPVERVLSDNTDFAQQKRDYLPQNAIQACVDAENILYPLVSII